MYDKQKKGWSKWPGAIMLFLNERELGMVLKNTGSLQGTALSFNFYVSRINETAEFIPSTFLLHSRASRCGRGSRQNLKLWTPQMVGCIVMVHVQETLRLFQTRDLPHTPMISTFPMWVLLINLGYLLSLLSLWKINDIMTFVFFFIINLVVN